MHGVEKLMVVDNPLAANPESASASIITRAASTLRGFGITPESALVGGGVGLALEPGVRGTLKGALMGSLLSLGLNYLANR
jgi:hypothetical protein